MSPIDEELNRMQQDVRDLLSRLEILHNCIIDLQENFQFEVQDTTAKVYQLHPKDPA